MAGLKERETVGAPLFGDTDSISDEAVQIELPVPEGGQRNFGLHLPKELFDAVNEEKKKDNVQTEG